MAWNGSDQTKVGAEAAPRRGRTDVGTGGSAETTRGARHRLGGALTADRCNKRRGLIAGLIVVALGGSAVWWFFGSTRQARKTPDATSTPSVCVIPAVTPNPATNHVAEAAQKPVRSTKTGTIIPEGVQLAEDGVYRYKNGLAWYDSNTVSRAKSWKKKRLFSRMCDNKIAMILTLDPARMASVLIGRRRPFDQRFVEDFKASLSEPPVLPQEDDTEEDKSLRKLVAETRLELKDALDRGEDIAQLMNDAQNELDRLASYRNDLKKELAKISRNEDCSDADVEDYVTAANKMLGKQGLKKN